MGLKKLAAKVAGYNARFEQGNASKITPEHVAKVLEKLRLKSEEVEAEIASEESPEKIKRLKRKLEIARTQMDRAEWLLKEVS